MPLIVIIIGIILIVLNYLALKKEDNSFVGALKRSNDNFTEEKFELGRLRVEMAETITELQGEIERLKEEIRRGKVYIENDEKENEEVVPTNINEDIISEINFNNLNVIKEEKENKREQIIHLINKGFTDDDICKELSLGKGEVLLVRNLFKS